MLTLYSFIFNIIYKGYSKSGDEHPGIYAVGIVSLLPFFTVSEVILLPDRLKYKKMQVDGTIILLIFGAIMLLNYIYFYWMNTPKAISEKVESFTDKKKQILKYLTWLHVIVTVGLFAFIANLPSK